MRLSGCASLKLGTCCRSCSSCGSCASSTDSRAKSVGCSCTALLSRSTHDQCCCAADKPCVTHEGRRHAVANPQPVEVPQHGWPAHETLLAWLSCAQPSMTALGLPTAHQILTHHHTHSPPAALPSPQTSQSLVMLYQHAGNLATQPLPAGCLPVAACQATLPLQQPA